MKPNYLLRTSVLLIALAGMSGCSPRVEVAVPSEPITINLNVKIEHEILVKVDKEIDELLSENSDLF
jgi:type IV pilus biogenesis protein CpaD/CtpE